jgi:hypothetical protein
VLVALPAEKVRGPREQRGGILRCRFPIGIAAHLFSLRRADVDLVVFCFDKPEDAEAVCDRFGGEWLPERRRP